MACKSDRILAVLQKLTSNHAEISACMVAKRGLEGVIMFPESFKQEMLELWEPVESTINQVLDIISEKSSYNFEKAYIEILGHGVAFYVMPNSDTALILFIRLAGNLDALDFLSKNGACMCSARDEIIGLIEEP